MSPAPKKMKVLTLSAQDIEGGAARAAFRISQSVIQQNIELEFLCDQKKSDAPFVRGPRGIFEKISAMAKAPVDRLPLYYYPQRKNNPWGVNWKNWGRGQDALKSDADLVHLHWISNGFLGMNEIPEIKKPIDWTMHDMWGMTGGCHYTEGCERYQKSCGSCPQLKSHSSRDLSSWTLNQRLEKWRGLENLTLVAPSKWLAQSFEESAVFTGKKCQVIPYPIDTEVFRPQAVELVRDLLRLPRDKKLVLFTAMSATSDPRKGFQFLSPLLKNLESSYSKDELELVVVGASEGPQGFGSHFKTNFMGRLFDDLTLSLVYSACDVSLAPSVQENLALTVMESLACGTPVVAFRIGGMPDMIESQKNGELAELGNVEGLAEGVRLALKNSEWRTHARNSVLEKFSQAQVGSQYAQLYQNILQGMGKS